MLRKVSVLFLVVVLLFVFYSPVNGQGGTFYVDAPDDWYVYHVDRGLIVSTVELDESLAGGYTMPKVYYSNTATIEVYLVQYDDLSNILGYEYALPYSASNDFSLFSFLASSFMYDKYSVETEIEVLSYGFDNKDGIFWMITTINGVVKSVMMDNDILIVITAGKDIATDEVIFDILRSVRFS